MNCKICEDVGARFTVNLERKVFEVQRCDGCNLFGTDYSAGQQYARYLSFAITHPGLMGGVIADEEMRVAKEALAKKKKKAITAVEVTYRPHSAVAEAQAATASARGVMDSWASVLGNAQATFRGTARPQTSGQ